MLTVVKAGGAWLDGEPDQDELDALAGLTGRLVVVHGGGKEISRWQERYGIAEEWSDGLRVTRGDGLAISSMVLSGWLNKRLVRALSSAGRDCVGISGEDGDLVTALPVDPARLGAVGSVDRVNPGVLEMLIEGGYTPVVSPISGGPSGPLNVNADEAAARLSIALDADRLFLLSDVEGVRAHGDVVSDLDSDAAQDLRDLGILEGGMQVKVEQGLAATDEGVDVRIGDGGLLTGAGEGTRLRDLEPAGSTRGR